MRQLLAAQLGVPATISLEELCEKLQPNLNANALPTFSALQELIVKESYELLKLETDEKEETKINSAYRKLALQHHPDKGGEPKQFDRLNAAHKDLLFHLKLRNTSVPVPAPVSVSAPVSAATAASASTAATSALIDTLSHEMIIIEETIRDALKQNKFSQLNITHLFQPLIEKISSPSQQMMGWEALGRICGYRAASLKAIEKIIKILTTNYAWDINLVGLNGDNEPSTALKVAMQRNIHPNAIPEKTVNLVSIIYQAGADPNIEFNYKPRFSDLYKKGTVITWLKDCYPTHSAQKIAKIEEILTNTSTALPRRRKLSASSAAESKEQAGGDSPSQAASSQPSKRLRNPGLTLFTVPPAAETKEQAAESSSLQDASSLQPPTHTQKLRTENHSSASAPQQAPTVDNLNAGMPSSSSPAFFIPPFDESFILQKQAEKQALQHIYHTTFVTRTSIISTIAFNPNLILFYQPQLNTLDTTLLDLQLRIAAIDQELNAHNFLSHWVPPKSSNGPR